MWLSPTLLSQIISSNTYMMCTLPEGDQISSRSSKSITHRPMTGIFDIFGIAGKDLGNDGDFISPSFLNPHGGCESHDTYHKLISVSDMLQLFRQSHRRQ